MTYSFEAKCSLSNKNVTLETGQEPEHGSTIHIPAQCASCNVWQRTALSPFAQILILDNKAFIGAGSQGFTIATCARIQKK